MIFAAPLAPPPLRPDQITRVPTIEELGMLRYPGAYPKLIIGPFGGCFVSSERGEKWFWRINFGALIFMLTAAVVGLSAIAVTIARMHS